MFYKGSITEALHQSNRTFFPLLVFIVDPSSTQQELQSVEEAIRSASLRSSAILHLLLVGSVEFAQFTAASNMKETTVTPRVCIFPPASRGLPPYVLAGKENVTAEKLSEAVAVSLMLQESTLKEVFSQGLHTGKLDKAERESAAFRQAVAQANPAPKTSALSPKGTTARAEDAQQPAPAATVSRPNQNNNNNNNNSTGKAEDAPKKPSGMVCDGDVCRPAAAVKTPSLSGTTASTSSLSSSTAAAEVASPKQSLDGSSTASSPAARPSTTPGVIDVRCTMPDGSNVVASALTAATSTLHDVALVVEGQIGHRQFSFSNAFPPRRFTQEEWTQPLAALGITRPTTLRVTMLATLQAGVGASSAPPASTAPSQPPAAGAAAAAAGGLVGALGSLTGGLASWMRPGSASSAGASAVAQPADPTEPTRTLPGLVRPTSRGGIATLASLRAEEQEQKDKKPTSYYGGNSTEFQDGPK